MSLQEEKVLYCYKHKPSESWIFDIIMVSIGIPFLIIWAKLFDGIGEVGTALWILFVFMNLCASVVASIEKSSYRLIITNHKVEIRKGSNSESIMMHRVEAVDYEGHVVVIRGSGGTKIETHATDEKEKIRQIVTQAAMLAHKHKDSVA